MVWGCCCCGELVVVPSSGAVSASTWTSPAARPSNWLITSGRWGRRSELAPSASLRSARLCHVEREREYNNSGATTAASY